MIEYQSQIIKTLIVIIIFIILKLLTKKIVYKVGIKFNYQHGRIKITNKLVGFLLAIILVTLITIIWGVDQSQLVLFLSTIITILGVAFFAQWSIISNITSTLIIFFNHPIRIGDSLSILDKEYEIDGTLSDIGIFFITIKTKEGKKVVIPSNVFMQKMIKKVESEINP